MTRVRLPVTHIDAAHKTTALTADRAHGDSDGTVTHRELDEAERRAAAPSSSIDAVRRALDAHTEVLVSGRGVSLPDVDAALAPSAQHIDRFLGNDDGVLAGDELARFAARLWPMAHR